MRQILHVVRLNCVLVQRVARSASDAQILRRLQECRSNRKPVQLGPQAIDNRRAPRPCATFSGLSAM